MRGERGQQAEDPTWNSASNWMAGRSASPPGPAREPRHQQTGEQPQPHRHETHPGQGKIFLGGHPGTPELRQLQHPESPSSNRGLILHRPHPDGQPPPP